MKDLKHTLIPMEEKGEIVLYQPDDSVRLEVRFQDETVWLTQQQMAELLILQGTTSLYIFVTFLKRAN